MSGQILKSKLLVTVSVLVTCSDPLISLLVTERYSASLFDAMTTQAKNLAHAVHLQTTDKILINGVFGGILLARHWGEASALER
jgi:hypothetical protein